MTEIAVRMVFEYQQDPTDIMAGYWYRDRVEKIQYHDLNTGRVQVLSRRIGVTDPDGHSEIPDGGTGYHWLWHNGRGELVTELTVWGRGQVAMLARVIEGGQMELFA